jgi:hypothetical protein
VVLVTLLDENDDWASSALVSAGSTCTLYWDRLCAGSAYTITSDGILYVKFCDLFLQALLS